MAKAGTFFVPTQKLSIEINNDEREESKCEARKINTTSISPLKTKKSKRDHDDRKRRMTAL